MQLTVLPGRECGECHVCCEALTVDSAEFQKHGGCQCVHALPDRNCGIYANRYPVCRQFECGWRIFKWVRQSLRPDRSGVLVSPFGEPDTGPAKAQGIVIYLLEPGALDAEGLAETVAAAIAGGVEVMVGVHGPPGQTSNYVSVTEEIRGAVRARDKRAVLDVLRQAREWGLGMKFEPVVLPDRSGAKP